MHILIFQMVDVTMLADGRSFIAVLQDSRKVVHFNLINHKEAADLSANPQTFEGIGKKYL